MRLSDRDSHAHKKREGGVNYIVHNSKSESENFWGILKKHAGGDDKLNSVCLA